MSVMPGDLVKLLSPVDDYPVGTAARVIVALDGDECVVEIDDGRQFRVAVGAVEIQRWAALGMGQI